LLIPGRRSNIINVDHVHFGLKQTLAKFPRGDIGMNRKITITEDLEHELEGKGKDFKAKNCTSQEYN
jgi:hypothetical protein